MNVQASNKSEGEHDWHVDRVGDTGGILVAMLVISGVELLQKKKRGLFIVVHSSTVLV